MSYDMNRDQNKIKGSLNTFMNQDMWKSERVRTENN